MLLGLYKNLTFNTGKVYPYATGGDYVYLYEDTTTGKTYRVHEFLSTGTLNVEVGGQMDILVVGGGGGGGRGDGGCGAAGGGGAGKFIEFFGNVMRGTCTITVGGGGASRTTNGQGNNGSNSIFTNSTTTITASGGGGGGGNDTAGKDGGSGGGGACTGQIAGNSDSYTGDGVSYGNNGGTGLSYEGGGGGGGAEQAGLDATSSPRKAGNGGNGRQWLNGKYYAGGGGGAAWYLPCILGDGGLGGGGDGASPNAGGSGENGTENTGGGGGGGMGGPSGAGGSGIVIVRYVVAEKKLWTPSEILELQCWLDASDSSTTTLSGSSVTLWKDKVGNNDADDAVNTSNVKITTKRPTLVTNAQNGLSAINFNGSQYFDHNSARDMLRNKSSAIMAVVMKYGSVNTSTFQFAWTNRKGTTSGDIANRFQLLHSNSNVFSTSHARLDSDSIVAVDASTSSFNTNWHIHIGECIWENGVANYFLNGIKVGTGSYASSGKTQDTSLGTSSNTWTAIGNTNRDQTNSNPLSSGSRIGEMLCFAKSNGTFSDTDRQKLEGYLAHKWGLTNNLPAGHPYKYEPPYKVEPEEIVTDGLVLNLDAGDYASYPRSGTTWYDISGNGLTGALTNGPTYDSANKGSIVFDGSDDYVILNNTPSSLQGNPSFSVEGWFKKNGDWFGGASWGIGGNSSLQGINSYIYNSTDQSEISIDLWGTSTYTTNVQYSSTEWKHIVWTYNGQGFTTSNIIIYINGVPYTGNDLETKRGGSGTPNINSSGIVLGRAGTTTNNYYGKPIIANFRIYSKVLSSTEISQNFNALRGRYGI